jgi:HlyD family secretion protein
MKNQFVTLSRLLVLTLAFSMLLISCGNNGDEADAYGNFEADEIIVSAQSQGVLLQFDLTEGSELIKDQFVGRIDSSVPSLKKKQLLAQYNVIDARLQNIDVQLKVQDEQRINMAREVDRMEKLLQDKAATQQQYDDLSGKLKVLDTQTETIKSQKKVIHGEQSVLKAQLEEADNLLEKCRVISPISGTVLEKYIDAGELVTPGKALFKVADITEMELKVYISGSQLSSVAIGDTVTILVDGKDKTIKTTKGVVTWISSQAEFTPKIIQTREERVNMVYAVKIRVANDGSLKIGMPGEVIFKSQI